MSEPQTLIESLVSQRAGLGGVGCFLGSSYSGIVKPEHADHLKLSAYCGIGSNRALAESRIVALARGKKIGIGTPRKCPAPKKSSECVFGGA